MSSLAEELPRQQARCREILEHAVEIGPAGQFLTAMLRSALQQAEHAAASGDVIAMLLACKELAEFKE